MKKYSKLGLFKSKGRLFYERPNKFRTPFQRDRDRIIHSAPFRRLKHKTQVFVNTEGDHYRTRITHSIEVAQIARTISKYLNLNDDLAETLSLSHDLGHTPFGHAGEGALNECMQNYGGFDHNLQTLRIVMFLENKYLKFKGLNLTIETLDGLLKHNGPINEKKKLETIIGINNLKSKIKLDKNTSLEAQIASISDDIAYNNHDIQDGIKAKLFTLKQLTEIEFFKEILNTYKKNINKNNKEIIIYQIIRDSINLMVKDVIKKTISNIRRKKIKNISSVYNSKNQIVEFSSKFKLIEREIKLFLKKNMYNNKNVLNRNNKGKKIIKKLFKIITKKPKKFINSSDLDKNKFRAIADYISGMTDRFAINLYKSKI
tara:strand:- start:1188 stop:2306 length:1119 start_codon:yes stop_codon:yes gene_type:complete